MTRLYMFLQAWVASHQDEDEGATMVEYGIMVAGIAVLVLGTVFILGGAINDLFQSVVDGI